MNVNHRSKAVFFGNLKPQLEYPNAFSSFAWSKNLCERYLCMLVKNHTMGASIQNTHNRRKQLIDSQIREHDLLHFDVYVLVGQ